MGSDLIDDEDGVRLHDFVLFRVGNVFKVSGPQLSIFASS
jgi:hypothetical protein